jgi:hypothetical protein
MRPDFDNPKGYREPLGVNTLMQRLLKAAGSFWHDWRALDLSSVPPADMKFITDGLLAVVREFDGADLLGIKDPLICRAVPLWLDLFRQSGREPTAVLMFRHPTAVARSLSTRDGIPKDKALLLWLRHVLDAERDTRSIPRVFIDYGELIKNWGVLVERIAERLAITWPKSPKQCAAEVSSFLRPNPGHYPAIAGEEMGGGSWYQEAWSMLSGEDGDPGLQPDRFDSLRARVSETTRPFEAYFGAVEQALDYNAQQTEALSAAIEHARSLVGRIALGASATPGELVERSFLRNRNEIEAVSGRLVPPGNAASKPDDLAEEGSRTQPNEITSLQNRVAALEALLASPPLRTGGVAAAGLDRGSFATVASQPDEISIDYMLQQTYDRDLIISKLRSYVSSLEKRLASKAHISEDVFPEPVGALPLVAAFDESGRLSESSEASGMAAASAWFTVLTDEDTAGTIESISRVEGGFWIHPRPGRALFGCIGPFEGPAPVLLTASVGTEHPRAPLVSFTLDIVRSRMNEDILLETAVRRSQSVFSWVPVETSRRKLIVLSFSAEDVQWSKWALLLGVRTAPDTDVEFAWATFKDIRYFHGQGQEQTEMLVA